MNLHKICRTARQQQAGDEPPTILGDIAASLPAMMRAVKLQKRAASVGFDWPNLEQVIDKLYEETEELKTEWDKAAQDQERIKDEIGDILFLAANLARKAGIDPETALINTNNKFERRFGYIVSNLQKKKIPIENAGIGEMDKLWNEAKQQEKES